MSALCTVFAYCQDRASCCVQCASQEAFGRANSSTLAAGADLHAAHEPAAGAEGGQLVRQLRQRRGHWEAAAVEGLSLGRQLRRRVCRLACNGITHLPNHTMCQLNNAAGCFSKLVRHGLQRTVWFAQALKVAQKVASAVHWLERESKTDHPRLQMV